MCGGMVYSATEWTAVLANLASGGALLRVLCPSRGSFEGSGVGASRLTVMHASARGLGLRRAGGRTAASVAMSCRLGLPQRRGWWRSGGMATQGPWQWRRHTSLVRRHGVVPCGCETGVRTLFEGSAVLFRGCGVWVVREWVAQCLGADTGLTAQCRTVAGMASPGVLAKQCRDMIPRWGQRDGMAGIASAGGVGARSPRARRRPARGGVQPSSEAEFR
jgi:hypothetical protein